MPMNCDCNQFYIASHCCWCYLAVISVASYYEITEWKKKKNIIMLGASTQFTIYLSWKLVYMRKFSILFFLLSPLFFSRFFNSSNKTLLYISISCSDFMNRYNIIYILCLCLYIYTMISMYLWLKTLLLPGTINIQKREEKRSRYLTFCNYWNTRALRQWHICLLFVLIHETNKMKMFE